MCLMLYLATERDQPLMASPELTLEHVEDARSGVLQWLSLPTVRFIGSYTGCSCGFEYVVAEEPIEYWEGMFLDYGRREEKLASMRALIALIGDHLSASETIELYPVWDGNEGLAPKGTIALSFGELDPKTFFFNEQFLYRVTRDGTEASVPSPAGR